MPLQNKSLKDFYSKKLLVRITNQLEVVINNTTYGEVKEKNNMIKKN